MALVGDPNASFESRRKKLEQQRQMLLNQARAAQQIAAPSMGQMVGNTFVPAHWSQYLAGPAGQAISGLGQGMVDRQQKILDAEEAGAASAHMASMPQARTREFPGPTETGEPLTGTVQPSREDKIKWAQAGMNIPSLRETLTKAFEDQLIQEPVREEARQFRSEESAAQRAQVYTLRMEQLKQEAQRQQERLDDRGLDRQAREDASKRHDATLRSIAALNADVRKDVANISANKTKPLSDKARADLDAAEAQMRGLEQASESLKTASDKGVGYLPGLVQSYLPGGTALVNMVRDKPTKDAIQQLTYVSGEIQHGRFGASLTKGEKADAAQYLPEPYDSKAELQRKATGLQNLLDLSNRRLRERGESEGGATGTWSAPPAKAGTGQRRKWNPATGKLE